MDERGVDRGVLLVERRRALVLVLGLVMVGRGTAMGSGARVGGGGMLEKAEGGAEVIGGAIEGVWPKEVDGCE